MKRFSNILKQLNTLLIQEFPSFLLIVLYITLPASFYSSYSIYRLIIVMLVFVMPQAFLPAIILTWLSSKKSWLKWSIFTLINFFSFIEIVCLFNQETRFTSSLAILIMQSNVKESSEFILTAWPSITKAFGVLAAIILLYISFEYLWQHKISKLIINWLSQKRIANILMGGGDNCIDDLFSYHHNCKNKAI